MQITETIIRKTFTEGNLKAVVSITIDNCLALHDIKVIEANGKTFVAMPSRRDESGIYRDIVHPMHSALRNKLEAEILKTYEKHIIYEKVMNSCISS